MAKGNPTPRDCRISEILQYSCNIDVSDSNPEVQCFPIPRIFRVCPGRPAVEITRYVTIDLSTGEIEIPRDVRDIPVQGKSWHEIARKDIGQERQ